MKRLGPMLFMLLVPSLAHARVVWRGDFETGNISQFTRTQMVSADRLQVVQSPTKEGRYALKATVRQGDDPIGASGNRNELVYTSNEPVGSEYFYKWSTMFAANYPSANTWQLFAQWHHYGCCGSPPIQFVVNGEKLYLAAVGETVWSAPLIRGQWLDFVFHVKWSPDAKVGFIEMWVDGKLVVPRRNVATMFPNDINYLKVGLYRNSTIAPEGVVFHDGWMQATTLGDVMPGATTPPAPQPTPAPEPTPTPLPSPTPTTPVPDPLPPPESEDGFETSPPPPSEDTHTHHGEPMTGDSPPVASAAGCSAAGHPLALCALLGLAEMLRRRRRC